MQNKVIGIIGGMGPEATLDFFRKILLAHPVSKDQDQIRIIIDCNSKIPDRVTAIFENTEDPTEALIKTAQNLERAGAQLLMIACNAAHYYHEWIQNSVSIPVLNIMKETAIYCQKHFPEVRHFGLLAGSSTVEVGIYPKAFEKTKAKLIMPEPGDQREVMKAIYAIKAGNLGRNVKDLFLTVSKKLEESGAKAIIIGCTEIPLVIQNGDLPNLSFIDANQVIAEAAVALACE